MSNRERLPNRRASQLFDVEVGERKYRCTVSFYGDPGCRALVRGGWFRAERRIAARLNKRLR